MAKLLEIWEKDPMMVGGCACAPVRITQIQADRIVGVMRQRDETVKRLKIEFPELNFERDVIHPQRPRSSYPDHVRDLIDAGADAPLIFLDEKLVFNGAFPDYEEFKRILDESRVNL